MESRSKTCDTIIIGGGLAGISCAHHLFKDSNYKGNVILLEARNRLGGRIVGSSIGGQSIELGANWIHGIINNPIYNLAAYFKLIDPLDINSWNKDEFTRMGGRTSTGDPVPYKTIHNVYRNYFSMLKRCENYYMAIKKGNVFEEKSTLSVGQWMKAEIDKYLDTLNEPEKTLESAIFNNFLNRETCISGCHTMDQVSLPYFGAYEELPGGNITIPGGYRQLIDCLVNEIETKLSKESRTSDFQIFVNSPVKKIRWPGIGSDKKKDKAEVITENGTTYSCRHVVCTIPLGVLKNCYNQLFDPPLPQYKIDCINSLGFGTVDKIFIEFKEPISPKYIDPSLTEILTFWLPQDLGIVKWAAKIYSFAKVGDRCLLAWVSGREAHLVEKLDNCDIKKHLTAVLRKVLKAPDLPNPIDLIVTRWGRDPYTQGSYTYISNESSVGDLDRFGQPIYSNPGQEKPNLVFAGEACHPSFFSTTHGAYLTGRKAALYLIDSDENNSRPNSAKEQDSSKKLSNL